MTDRHYILLLLLLLPALALAQTIHFEKDKVVYKGKMEFHSSGKFDNHNKAKEMLLNVVHVPLDSLQEDKAEQEFTGRASIRIPSAYHIIKVLDYKISMKPGKDEIAYEIGDFKLNVRERGKKGKVLRAEEILKGMEESGKVGMMAERQLNEIDMHIQKLIASMQSELN